jgi:hypothetical protein
MMWAAIQCSPPSRGFKPDCALTVSWNRPRHAERRPQQAFGCSERTIMTSSDDGPPNIEPNPRPEKPHSPGHQPLLVNDGGTGIRCNFPGFAPFRPITWEEWLGHFDLHYLLFVFEEQDPAQVATRAHERSRSHDGIAERDQGDWFFAERDLREARGGASASVRYQLVKDDAAVPR